MVDYPGDIKNWTSHPDILAKFSTETKFFNFEFDKVVKMILHQVMREYSSEGQVERDKCFGPILEILDQIKVSESSKILVPGCGLGRLNLEISHKLPKSKIIGNEFSRYMLWTSNLILSQFDSKTTYKIHPFVHTTSNNFDTSKICRSISIPDIDVSRFGENMEIHAGNFLEVFRNQNEFEVVTTCFFIDTGRNLIDYLEHIYAILKPDGYWINNGPLFYHYADQKNLKNCLPEQTGIPNLLHEGQFYKMSNSIEYSLQQVIEIAKNIGFQFLKIDANFKISKSEDKGDFYQKVENVPYSHDSENFMKHSFDTFVWCCQK